MNFIETELSGCFIIEPKIFKDDRGYFLESYSKERFNRGIGREVNFVQDNQSFSSQGVIRALHYQLGDYAQAKLVRVLNGTVLDVAVDLRENSPTFGKHFSVELSRENKRQLFIPRGFGHGFAVLSDTAEFFYKCDNYYSKESEGGIVYNDRTLNIDWRLASDKVKVSEKDIILPTFENARL
jgi:dTDP-4-dehydrorhamnose 3,5-epimerase